MNNLQKLSRFTGRRLALAAAFAGIGGLVAHGETLNALSYVQKGLVALYDGIENAGAGQHDANATTWADLTGNGNDGTVDSRITWAEDGWVYTDTTVHTKTADIVQPVILTEAIATNFPTHSCTIECASKPTFFNKKYPLYGRCCYFSNYSNSSKDGDTLELTGNAQYRVYEAQGVYDFTSPAQSVANKTFSTFAATFDGPAVTGFADGKKFKSVTNLDYATTAKFSSAAPVIGCERATTRDMTFRGTYHGCRVYNRPLTVDELALNAAIDRVRFAGADPTTQAWPDGYSCTAESNLQVRVTAVGLTGGGVTLNGQVADDGIYTVLHNSEMTVEAKPAAGFEFVKWLGEDVDSVQATQATITVTVRAPTTFTAVFRRADASALAGECVQHGLYVWLDGKDNAGTGEHSDDSTIWADLSGHGKDGTLAKTIGWAADGWTNDADGKPVTLDLSVSETLSAKGTFTVDFACRPSRMASRECYFGQYAGNTVYGPFSLEHNSGSAKDGGFRFYQLYASKKAIDEYSKNAYAIANEEVTLAAVVTPETRTMLKNGLLSDTFSSGTMIGVNTKYPLIVGGENSRTAMAFHGTYHAFRLYTRALTEAELMINAAVDALRYRGVALEDVRLPEGASFDAQTNILVQVSVGVKRGMGRLVVDDGAEVGSYRAAKRLNDAVSLTALPSFNSVPFAYWEGDVDLIEAGATNTASIVVSAARPLKLTAVFKKEDGSDPTGLILFVE